MNPSQALQSQWNLRAGLFASNFLDLGDFFYVGIHRSGPTGPGPERTLKPVLAAIAAVSVRLPRRLIRAYAALPPVELRDDVKDDPLGARQGFRRPATSERIFADPDTARRLAVAQSAVAFIVGMALALQDGARFSGDA
jgi:hypothetical protein